MPVPHLLLLLRLPASLLIALDDRTLHFALQPWHFLIRIVHIVSMAWFFGAIILLDLRLMGVRGTVPLKPFAHHTLPWVYAAFGVAVVSGAGLFLYDPVAVGSHAYFVPKLILVALGVVNALLYHRTFYVAALAAEQRMPLGTRVAGTVSLLLWTGVVIFACLNTEGLPKVLLR